MDVSQGATCYLTSLLQSLYVMEDVRRAVFDFKYLGAEVHGPAESCVPLQLGRLFARLQYSRLQAVATRALTASFGWSRADVYQMHDVQECCRVLFDCLTHGGVPIEQKFFRGSLTSSLRCLRCGYERTRSEAFSDVALGIDGLVRGRGTHKLGSPSVLLHAPCRPDALPRGYAATPHRQHNAVLRPRLDIVAAPPVPQSSVCAALEHYVTAERLEGEDAWYCDKCCARVPALKAVAFERLPPILMLQLKRYAYDTMTLQRCKLTHAVSFPLTLSMGSFMTMRETSDGGSDGAGSSDGVGGSDGSNGSSGSGSTIAYHGASVAESDDEYEFHGALLHSGTAQDGHYSALLRAGTPAAHYHFDDEHVAVADREMIDGAAGKGPPRSAGVSQAAAAACGDESADIACCYCLIYRKRASWPSRGGATGTVSVDISDEAAPAPMPAPMPPLALLEEVRREEDEAEVLRAHSEAASAIIEARITAAHDTSSVAALLLHADTPAIELLRMAAHELLPAGAAAVVVGGTASDVAAASAATGVSEIRGSGKPVAAISGGEAADHRVRLRLWDEENGRPRTQPLLVASTGEGDAITSDAAALTFSSTIASSPPSSGSKPMSVVTLRHLGVLGPATLLLEWQPRGAPDFATPSADDIYVRARRWIGKDGASFAATGVRADERSAAGEPPARAASPQARAASPQARAASPHDTGTASESALRPSARGLLPIVTAEEETETSSMGTPGMAAAQGPAGNTPTSAQTSSQQASSLPASLPALLPVSLPSALPISDDPSAAASETESNDGSFRKRSKGVKAADGEEEEASVLGGSGGASGGGKDGSLESLNALSAPKPPGKPFAKNVRWTSQLADLVEIRRRTHDESDSRVRAAADAAKDAARAAAGGVAGGVGGRRISWDLSELVITPSGPDRWGEMLPSTMELPLRGPPPSSASSVSSRRSSGGSVSSAASNASSAASEDDYGDDEASRMSEAMSDDGSRHGEEEEEDDDDEDNDDERHEGKLVCVPGGASESATLASLRRSLEVAFGVPPAKQHLVVTRNGVPLLLAPEDGVSDDAWPLSRVGLRGEDEIFVEAALASDAPSVLYEKREAQRCAPNRHHLLATSHPGDT